MKAKDETEALKHMEAQWGKLGNQLSGTHKGWVQAKLNALEFIWKHYAFEDVLDLGVGDQAPWLQFTPYTEERFEYVGVDGSQLILDAARVHEENKHNMRAGFECIPFSEFIKRELHPSVDLVVALDVLYHLPTQQLHDDFLEFLFGYGEHDTVLLSWATDMGQTFSNANRPGDSGYAWFARPFDVPESWERVHHKVARSASMPQQQALGVFRRV